MLDQAVTFSFVIINEKHKKKLTEDIRFLKTNTRDEDKPVNLGFG